MKKKVKLEVVSEPLAVSIVEAAALIGSTRTAVYALIKSGAIRSIKAGKRRTIAVAELRRYVARATGGKSSRIENQPERARPRP